MGIYKQKLNPRTGQFNLVPSNTVITFKDSVATFADLPLVGNTQNDARITNDTGHLYVWDGSAWIDQGDILDINWSAISGKPASTPADIDDAVTKRHTQETDKYLETMVTNVLYVDNKRTDVYVANGSITKPFLTIQAANDAIIGNSVLNRFVIKIATGNYYSEVLTLNKDFTTIEGYGETLLSGAITITSPHIRLTNLKIISAVTLSLANHFLLEVVDCSTDSGVWNITATAPLGDEWFQISGDTTIWKSNINATGITGVASIAGGYFEGVQTYTNCWVELMGFETWGTINLEADTEATIGATLPIDAIVNLKPGAILNADSSFLSGITLNNTGGVLNKTTKAENIKNIPAGNIASTDVQAALNELDAEKTQVISVNTTYTVKAVGGDFTTIQDALNSLKSKWINSDVSVTISVEAGLFTHTSPILFRHPLGNRINIVGAAPIITSITSLVSWVGSAGNYSVTLNVGNTTGMSIGDYCLVNGNTTGTGEYQAIKGCWEIINILSPTQLVVKNTYRKSTIPTLTITGGSLHCLKTTLKFNGCDGIQVGGATGYLYNLAIVGNGVANTDGINISQRGYYYGTNIVYMGEPSGTYSIGINGFGRYGVCNTSTAEVWIINASVCNCGSYGVYAYNQSKIAGSGVNSCGNGSIGVYATDGAFITMVSSFAVGNGTVGFYAFNRAGINAESAQAVGNIYSGFQCLGTSYIYAKSSKSINNGYHGYSSSYNGMIYAQSSVATGNGTVANYYGYWSSNGGHIRADSTTASGNFSGDYRAENFSFIKVTGYVGTPTFSPAVDVVGNGNALIRNLDATVVEFINTSTVAGATVKDALNTLGGTVLNAITSTASGDWKKIVSMEYNPITGNVRINYEA